MEIRCRCGDTCIGSISKALKDIELFYKPCNDCKTGKIKKFSPLAEQINLDEIDNHFGSCNCGKRHLDVVISHVLKVMMDEGIKDKKAKHTFNYEAMKDGDWGDDILKKPEKQMRSVWAIGAIKSYEKKFGKHPTQKPQELLKRIILASTDKGDLILDPFTGSSTTGIMAIKLGRKFVGIDTEKEYLDLSIQRFEDLSEVKKEEKE